MSVNLNPAERRGKGRVRCENVLCNLGAVLEISTSGVRIRRTGLRALGPGRAVKLRLLSSEGVLVLRGRVAWSRSIGFWQQEFGVQFEQVTRQQEAMLNAIGRHNRQVHAA